MLDLLLARCFVTGGFEGGLQNQECWMILRSLFLFSGKSGVILTTDGTSVFGDTLEDVRNLPLPPHIKYDKIIGRKFEEENHGE